MIKYLTKYSATAAFSLIAAAAYTPVYAQLCAIPGKDGPASPSGVVNTYYAGGANLTAGTTSLTLGALRTGGATTPPQTGDLLLIVQMQGATINAVNNNCYGDGLGPCSNQLTRTGDPARGYTGTPTAGRHEYVRVVSAVGSAITFQGSGAGNGLINSYTQAAPSATQGQQSYQIIRVPQYSALTLNSATPLTAPAWDGSSGGVVAIDVTGTLATNGGAAAHINVSNLGFRGGFGQRGNGPYDITDYMNTAQALGQDRDTTKGEGIAGTPKYVFNGTAGVTVLAGTAQGYPGGDYGRGAPANAGGGGVGHNTGGGGGGNGGAGGLGGAEFNSQDDYGAYGGAAFPQTGAPNPNLLVMGGGGGAGDTNGGGTDPTPDIESAGGVGGGMIFVTAGNIGNRLNLFANGQAGQNSSCETGGGGGAGGSIKVIATAGLGNAFATATGGAGGSNDCTIHSAGGGGGGGVVVSNGAIGGATLTPGAAGVAPSGGNWNGVVGSTGQSATTASTDLPGVDGGASCLPSLTVTKSTSTPTLAASGATTATYTLTVANSSPGAAIGAALVDNTLPPGWTFASTTSITFTPPLSGTALGGFVEGATPGVPAVAGSPGGVANLLGPTTSPGSAAAPWFRSVTIPGSGSASVTYTVNIPATEPAGVYHNPAGVQYRDPTRTAATTVVTPLTNNTANRAGAQVGGTTVTTYQGGVGGNVPGSNYSGLEGGPATENITLQADLSVTKTHSPATWVPGAAGQSYSVIVRNNGRAISALTYATDQATTAAAAEIGGNPVTVTDTLPAGVTLSATPTASNANWTCTGAVGAGSFSCTQNNAAYPLAAATDLVTITVPVNVASTGCPGPLLNTAVVSAAPVGEANSANNSGQDSAPLTCNANLSITKTDSRGTTTTGDTVVYTITASNTGPAAVTNALVRDPAPAGLSCTALTCSASGGAQCPAGALSPATFAAPGYSVPLLPSGGQVQFTLTCTVTATGS
jgi:uncharacterized repeat protein (TIGR01451 family)